MDLLTIIRDRINTELTIKEGAPDLDTGRNSYRPQDKSPLQEMTSIWVNIFDRVAAIWPRGFVSTSEIKIAESEVERVQALVISGKATLEDFRKAALSWEQIVTKEISQSSRANENPNNSI